MGPRHQTYLRPRTVQAKPVTTSGTPAPLCTFRSARPLPGHGKRPQPPATRTGRRRRGPSCRIPRQRHAVANEFLLGTAPGWTAELTPACERDPTGERVGPATAVTAAAVPATTAKATRTASRRRVLVPAQHLAGPVSARPDHHAADSRRRELPGPPYRLRRDHAPGARPVRPR